MNENKDTKGRFAFAKDTKVTVASLLVILVQSLIIILGMLFRWDWIVWEFGIMLIVPALVILYHGVAAIINANKLMNEERKIGDGIADDNQDL
jgi:hypothetical protein